MNKTQRKREAREKKARAKAARKARREDSLREPQGKQDKPFDGAQDRPDNEPGPVPGDAGGDARVPSAGVLPQDRVEQIRATGKRRTATELHREFQEQLAADPELREAVMAVHGPKIEERRLERTAEQAGDDLRDARDKVAQAKELNERSPSSASGRRPSPGSGRRITDQRALEMLEDAAEAVHEVLLMVRDALRGVSPERREAAREILNAKPTPGVDGRKQPRRGPDPVVTLQKLDLQAASLIKRILAKTNPNVGKKAA